MRILSKALLMCAIFVAGCAPDRNGATSRFVLQGTFAQQGTENADEISYWNGATPVASPG